jgi:alkanesulfonate monooxygenase SsuD/methylene tetrahydromethanopterin reductase-like flavin-dependent oxidoreductase (luciferase family)/acyl dehydratase
MLLRQARLAGDVGFDGVMISERHCVASNIPNPLQVTGWLLEAMADGWAAPCPLLLPLRPPAVVAEETAWLGARFPGRVGLGVAVGGHRNQFETLGIDFDARVRRFEPGLRLLVDVLTGDGGPLAADAAVALCRDQPIPVVSAALSEGAVDRAVATGAGVVGDSLSTLDRIAALLDRYAAQQGKGPRVVIRRVWIGHHPVGRAAEQLEEYRAAASPRRAAEWGDTDQAIVAPSADDLVGALAAVLDRVGPVALNLRVHATGVSAADVEDQIIRLGDEVVPRLRTLPAPPHREGSTGSPSRPRVGAVSIPPGWLERAAELAQLVGCPVVNASDPYVEEASADAIRHFARAYGDDNPLYSDPAYARSSGRGGLTAPPLFPIAAGLPRSPSGTRPPVDVGGLLRGAEPTVVADRWTLHRPVTEGIRLERISVLGEVVAGSDADPDAVDVTVRTSYVAADVLFASHDRTRRYRAAAGAPVPDWRPRQTYTPGALADIDRQGGVSDRRGAAPRWAGDVAVGDRLGPMVKGPLTITDLVTYRAGVGPGPLGAEALDLARRNRSLRPELYTADGSGAPDTVERRHYDEQYARSLGHPTAYDYSHTRLTWFSHLLTDWMGDGGWLFRLSVSADGLNYLGDTHWVTGRVVDVADDGRHGSVTIALMGRNQRDETTCRGEAVALLPLHPAPAVRLD